MKDIVIGLVCWVGTVPRLPAVSFMTTPTWSSYLLNSNILQQLYNREHVPCVIPFTKKWPSLLSLQRCMSKRVYYTHRNLHLSSWWIEPNWKILVKLDHFPIFRVKKTFETTKPPPGYEKSLTSPFRASPPFPQQLQPPSIALISVALRHEPPWCLWRHLPDPRRYSVRWCPQTDERNVSHGISNRICDGPIRCVYIYMIYLIYINIYI